MKLALGTVQFGLDYGAFNAAGRVVTELADQILAVAKQAGIRTLDTANAYGESEAVLGNLDAVTNFHVVTKVRPLAASANPVAEFGISLADSMQKLRTAALDTVLFHRASDLLGHHGKAIWQAAEIAMADKLVGRFGVSVYDPDEADAIIGKFPVSVVQLPFSVFDQRARQSGCLDRLKMRGVEVHSRSAYLQGFALADPRRLPPYLEKFRSDLERFQRFASESGLDPQDAALGFVAEIAEIDTVIVGVQTVSELEQAVAAMTVKCPCDDMKSIASVELDLIDPSRWR